MVVDLRSKLRNLPDRVLFSDHFLLWRHEFSERRGVFVKAPYYVSGRRRKGALDTEQDISSLASFEDAIDAYEADYTYDGIGLALVGDGIAAFDLDKCLNDDGELITGHPASYIAQRAEAMGAYMEISPSGRGLRVLGISDNPEAYSKNGLEYWGKGRYVTLTGSLWANPKGLVDMSPIRATLPAKKRIEASNDDDDETLVTNRVIGELESALSVIPSDERELWIRIGLSLKSIGERGRSLWMEWSAKSDKFNERDAELTWDSFNPDRISYKTVFVEAQQNWGWENPRASKQEPEEDEQDFIDFALDLGEQKLSPTEFVIDGFMPVGVSLIAGSWGVGKSTNLIPLFGSVAHLTPPEWGFHPVLRRHVVWITEAPDQARDTIYSISKAEGSASWNEFKEWFHMIPAKRVRPKTLSALVKDAVMRLTYTLDNGFAIRPVVVLDTVSANIDIENESDNSEVGAAMSKLKEALPGVPLVLVGHTPKSSREGMDVTFRGAGAWEADAVATYFLMHDPETAFRFMVIGKVRFAPDFKEITFGHDGGRELVNTQWGEPQSKAYMHGVPCKSDGTERIVAQKQVKDEKDQQKTESEMGARIKKVLDIVDQSYSSGIILSRSGIKAQAGKNQSITDAAIEELVSTGRVRVEEIPAEYRRHYTQKLAVVPGHADMNRFLKTVEENNRDLL